jgi:hypothetical protein
MKPKWDTLVGVEPWMIWKTFKLFNQGMGWRLMPLTFNDIRETLHSFRLVREFPGKKETLKVIQELLSKDKLRKIYCYYAPSSWETRRQSLEHLAMIRAACDFLSNGSYWVKPLPTSGYNEKGVPDVIAVRKGDNPGLSMSTALTCSEGRLYVECETGKKHLYGNIEEWLAKTMIGKIDALLKKEEDEGGGASGSGVMFVLSEKLFDAYVGLYRRRHHDLMKWMGLLGRDRFLVYNIEGILPRGHE